MNTLLLKQEIGPASDLIRNGELVAVPTETVYGLAGDGLNEEAVAQIYEVKGRPAVKPLSLMVRGPEDIRLYCCDVPVQAFTLAEYFWPGPLTIVLPAKEGIPPIVLAGGKTVGLRCPDSPLTLQLIRESERPLAAPSANPSGETSPKSAEAVMDYFDGKIAAVIDGGPCTLGTESTILDMSMKPFRILRQGALQEKEIVNVLMKEMTVFGITGTTGSGKTTVLEWLKSKNAFVIDCDALYHDMLRMHEPMLTALRARFPETFEADGVLDRRRLAAQVFSDPQALLELNAITHRYIGEEIQGRLRQAALEGCLLAAVDAVELISSGASAFCDYTVAVLSGRQNRLERIMKRDGLSREEAEQRIDAQKPDSYYEEHCELVLRNDADRKTLVRECENILGGLIRYGR